MKYSARSSVATFSILIGSLMPACSLVVDSGRVQCSKNSDCTQRGGAFANSECIDSLCQADRKWRCLDEPAVPPQMSGMYQVTFLVQHLLTMKPLPGIKARLCRKLDVRFEESVGNEVLETDSTGQVTFQAAGGFDGYARFESPDIIPGLYFFNPPVMRDLPSIPISIGNASVITVLAGAAKVTQESDRGVVLLSAVDCNGAFAEGIKLKANVNDDKAVPFYSEGNLPSGTATQTDKSGYGGLLNAGAGTVSFSATLAASGREIGQLTVLVQEGGITYGSVVPGGI